MITIYHNPGCSKSREALNFLNGRFKEINVINYIQSGITSETIKEIINLLQIQPIDLVRTNESLWKEEYKGKQLQENDLVEILSKNPKLVQRPIIINGNKAVIGRPVESINQIL